MRLPWIDGRVRCPDRGVGRFARCGCDLWLGGATRKRIELLCLLALIVEDVGRYPGPKIGDIHQRVGIEIPRACIGRAL